MQRRTLLMASLCAGSLPAWAHHGWSSFDVERPLYLEGRALDVKWRNPHAEFTLELASPLRLPPDLAQRALPAQSAAVDGRALLAHATLPQRRDTRWHVELAPLSRLEQWKVPPLAAGSTVGLLGYSFSGEKGDAVLRAEYLFLGGQAYGLRSSPA